VAIIEEELRDDVVRAGIDLRLEMVHFHQAIRRGGMAFWKAGHTDAKTARIGMGSGFVETTDKFHEIARVLKRVARLIVVAFAWRIAAERENVSNARLRVAAQNRFDLRFAVADTGQ